MILTQFLPNRCTMKCRNTTNYALLDHISSLLSYYPLIYAQNERNMNRIFETESSDNRPEGFISWHELINPEAVTQRTEAGYQRLLEDRSLR